MIRSTRPFCVPATVSAAVLALSIGFLVTASTATAASGVDASMDTVTCDTVHGTLKAKPTFINGGTAISVQIKVKAVLDGCNTTAPVNIAASKLKGTLTLSTNDCLGLLGPVTATGTLTAKWKTSPGLLDSSSTITPGSFSGAIFSAPWGGFYLQLVFGASSVGGSFQGPDAGITSQINVVSSEDIATVFNACSTATGLKAATIGLGELKLQ